MGGLLEDRVKRQKMMSPCQVDAACGRTLWSPVFFLTIFFEKFSNIFFFSNLTRMSVGHFFRRNFKENKNITCIKQRER